MPLAWVCVCGTINQWPYQAIVDAVNGVKLIDCMVVDGTDGEPQVPQGCGIPRKPSEKMLMLSLRPHLHATPSIHRLIPKGGLANFNFSLLATSDRTSLDTGPCFLVARQPGPAAVLQGMPPTRVGASWALCFWWPSSPCDSKE